MSYPSWPTEVPSPFAESDPAYVRQDGVLRSQTEVGPAKVRRRFTGKYEKLTFVLHLTKDQRTAFFAFYDSEIYEVLPFQWVDLRTNETQLYRFTAPPKEQYTAGSETNGWWKVQIELETVLTPRTWG